MEGCHRPVAGGSTAQAACRAGRVDLVQIRGPTRVTPTASGSLRSTPVVRGGAGAEIPSYADSVPGAPEEESLARRGQRQGGARRTPTRTSARVRADDEGLMPVL